MQSNTALEACAVSFRYRQNSPSVLKHVSLRVDAGERVGILGPSGCGKSTLAKLLAGYITPTEGQILLQGVPLPARGICPVQLISQHPECAINPRWRMRRVLEEAGGCDEALLRRMGIEPQWLSRFSRALSGGELQRFCIARALCAGARFLIADEMTTMLDMVTQAQLWEVVLQEAEARGLGLVVITHSIPLTQRICTRVINFTTPVAAGTDFAET